MNWCKRSTDHLINLSSLLESISGNIGPDLHARSDITLDVKLRARRQSLLSKIKCSQDVHLFSQACSHIIYTQASVFAYVYCVAEAASLPSVAVNT